MPTNPGVFVFIAIIMVACLIMFVAMRRHDRKKEILVRRTRFEMIRKGESHKHPREAIAWLMSELYGSRAIASDTNRYYYFTKSDLDISPDAYRQAIITLLGIWWNELESAQPTIFNALNPIYYFNDKFNDIRMWMNLFVISDGDLGKDASLLLNNCVQNCCAMLEDTLQNYPCTMLENSLHYYHTAPDKKPSVGELYEALQEYRSNPSREQQDKWKKWVKAAYLRQANYILWRLREGHFQFPDSSEQVNKILAYLISANSEQNAINTNPAELKRLRGFMISV